MEVIDETITALGDDRLADSTFVDCTFRGLDLAQLTLRRVVFESCRFVSCDLRLLKPVGCRFLESGFVDSMLMGVNWTVAEWSSVLAQSPIAFAGCTLDFGSFAGLKLRGLVAYGCQAREVDFGGADLTGADLRFTDLGGAAFGSAVLRDVDLTGAENPAIAPSQLRGATVSPQVAASLLAGMGITLTADLPTRLDADEVLDRLW